MTDQTAKGPSALEEHVAHMARTIEDLSDVVARQETEIAMLTRRVQLLMEREAERESAAPGSIYLGDEKPPHW
ncbi:SlyX family protein [Pseudooceanicola sp. 502str34]|jgi:SlyX protein